MLEHHGTALEADLHRFYGLDLVDLYRGTLGVRKVAVLLEHLPPESAVRRRLGGDGSMTLVEHLLRSLSHGQGLQLYQGGGGKGKKPKPPKSPPTYEEQRKAEETNRRRMERWRRKYERSLANGLRLQDPPTTT